MGIAPLPSGWDAVRETLQGYAHALTAYPRSVAPPHPRWNHVAMEPTRNGWAAMPTPLADGAQLESELDLTAHRIVVRAGADEVGVDLVEAGSPVAVSRMIARIAESHGTGGEIDEGRVPDLDRPVFDPAVARAFHTSAVAAVEAMVALNATLDGEVTGPHLWPHGFDVATEWFSERTVDHGGSRASAQINLGWYPIEDGYLYSTPWPFDEAFAAASLPGKAVWHRSGWEGAKWDITEEIAIEDVTALGRRVHEAARRALSTGR